MQLTRRWRLQPPVEQGISPSLANGADTQPEGKGSGQAETPEEVQVRVAKEIDRFLSENSDCAKSFREKIRPLGEQYKRWYDEIDRDKVRCEQEQTEDQETAKHEPRRRDRDVGPPTDEYEWCDLFRDLDPDGVYWGKDARAKGRQHEKMFEAIRRQGWDVTQEEFESAWKEGHWGYWRRRWFNPVERLHKYLGLERVRVPIDPNPIWKRYKWVERFKPTSSIEAEVRDYVILAALCDIVLPQSRTRMTEDLWSENLLNDVWQLLRTWRGDDADKGAFVQAAWNAVKRDLTDTIKAQSTPGGDGSGQTVAGSETPGETENGRKPLTKRARIIWSHLQSLGDGEAMQLPEIQEWYETQADLRAVVSKLLDEGVWKRVRKELLPYGLQNTRGRGYWVKK